jgi:hypothetical protein
MGWLFEDRAYLKAQLSHNLRNSATIRPGRRGAWPEIGLK